MIEKYDKIFINNFDKKTRSISNINKNNTDKTQTITLPWVDQKLKKKKLGPNLKHILCKSKDK